MRSARAFELLWPLCILACSGNSLRGQDAAGDRPGVTFDADTVDAAVTDSAVTDAPVTPADAAAEGGPPRPTGRRSFVVSSTLTRQADAGAPIGPIPASHGFTLVLDWDRGMAMVGATGSHDVVSLAGAGSTGNIRDSFSFSLSSSASVTYESFDFSIDAAGNLSGTGQGRTFQLSSDIATIVPISITATGVPDTAPPLITSDANGALIRALDSVTLLASEPLPPDARVVLVDPQGSPVDVLPPPDQTIAACCFYLGGGKMWRYATQYTVRLDGVVDFAGNRAGGQITFSTGAPPVLVPEDGFESATGASLAGAQVLSGAGAPVISGARSLYIPPIAAATTPGRAEMTQLALRLTLSPGDTRIRFSFRTVNRNLAGSDYFIMGSEGGQIVVPPSLPTDTSAGTTMTIPNHGSVTVGPVMNAEFVLPPDASGEITLLRIVRGAPGVGLPPPPITGLIIDDLRVE